MVGDIHNQPGDLWLVVLSWFGWESEYTRKSQISVHSGNEVCKKK
jgi:hypothetical protein